MTLHKINLSEKLLVSGIFVTLGSIALTPFGTSLGMGLIALAWLFALFSKSLIPPTNKPLFWAMIGLFLWHVIGMIWTDHIPEGIATLRIKLPLIIVPLSLMTIKWRPQLWLPKISRVFILFTFIAAIIGLLNGWWQISHNVDLRPNQWSPFISHIRMGILLSIGWGGLLIHVVKAIKENKSSSYITLFSILYAVVALYYSWQTESITGIGMFAFATFYGITHLWVKKHYVGVLSFWSAVTLIFVVWLAKSLLPGPNPTNLPHLTPWGSKYVHQEDKVLEENGNRVWNYLAWDEVRPVWNKISDYDFDGTDKKGKDLKVTMTRYMASLGLPKDGASLLTLSKYDITAIENGRSSILDLTESGLRKRMNTLRFEVGNWIDGGNPSGNSVTQRWVYLQTGGYIVKSGGILGMLFGVGTGDLPNAFKNAYEELDTRLEKRFRHRTHNQYLAWLISGGIVALILWLLVLKYAWYGDEKWQSVNRLVWLILVVSCLAEDTLETQAGVTFAVFALVLFSKTIPKR